MKIAYLGKIQLSEFLGDSQADNRIVILKEAVNYCCSVKST